jgi:hypothetical protein
VDIIYLCALCVSAVNLLLPPRRRGRREGLYSITSVTMYNIIISIGYPNAARHLAQIDDFNQPFRPFSVPLLPKLRHNHPAATLIIDIID